MRKGRRRIEYERYTKFLEIVTVSAVLPKERLKVLRESDRYITEIIKEAKDCGQIKSNQ